MTIESRVAGRFARRITAAMTDDELVGLIAKDMKRLGGYGIRQNGNYLFARFNFEGYILSADAKIELSIDNGKLNADLKYDDLSWDEDYDDKYADELENYLVKLLNGWKAPRYDGKDGERYAEQFLTSLSSVLKKAKDATDKANKDTEQQAIKDSDAFDEALKEFQKLSKELESKYKELGVKVDVEYSSPGDHGIQADIEFSVSVDYKNSKSMVEIRPYDNEIYIEYKDGWSGGNYEKRTPQEAVSNIKHNYEKRLNEYLNEKQEEEARAKAMERVGPYLESFLLDSLQGSDRIYDRDLDDEVSEFEKQHNLPEGSVSTLDARSAMKALVRDGLAFREGNGWSVM